MQLTPFQCVFGYQPPLCPCNASLTDSLAEDDCFGGAHARLEQVAQTYKARADQHRGQAPFYQPGDGDGDILRLVLSHWTFD